MARCQTVVTTSDCRMRRAATSCSTGDAYGDGVVCAPELKHESPMPCAVTVGIAVLGANAMEAPTAADLSGGPGG